MNFIQTLTNDAGQTIIAFWIIGLQSGPCCYEKYIKKNYEKIIFTNNVHKSVIHCNVLPRP
jgi:hypothetical protein